MLVRAAEAKMLLQSLVVLSEKKDEKRKNGTNMAFLLINMIKLDCFSVVVFGVFSEMLGSALVNEVCRMLQSKAARGQMDETKSRKPRKCRKLLCSGFTHPLFLNHLLRPK